MAAALLLALSACTPRPAVMVAPASAPNPAPAPVGPPKYFLYVPPGLSPAAPVRVLLALHGVGGNGTDFAKAFLPLAQEHHWILAAPTFAYGDWQNPAKVRLEDIALDRQLQALLADVAWRVKAPVRNHVFLVGFSRGAQLADRFTLFHPERVAAVASLSAGTYTVPEAAMDVNGDGEMDDLPLPYGTADMDQWVGHALDPDLLRRVKFLVGVGGDDTNPNDVPRQWDPLLGSTRVTRALAFNHCLQMLDVPTQLTIFPGARHQLTLAMASDVDAFLSTLQTPT
jgi:poly(3-hydroxybutyrate) depolymerase